MEYLHIVMIIGFFGVLYFLMQENENNEKFTSKFALNDKIYLGHPQHAGGYNFMEDSLFSNVITHLPDDKMYNGHTAIDSCLENCDGKCIEFGHGHAAHCFPNDM